MTARVPGPSERLVLATVPDCPAQSPCVEDRRSGKRCCGRAHGYHVVLGEHPAAAAEVERREVEQLVCRRPPLRAGSRRGGGVRRGHRHGVLSRHGHVSAGCPGRHPERDPGSECQEAACSKVCPVVRRSSRSSTDQPALQYEKRPGACTSGSGRDTFDEVLDRLVVLGQQVGSATGLGEQRAWSFGPEPLALRGAGHIEREIPASSGVQDDQSGQRLGDGAGVERRAGDYWHVVAQVAGARAEHHPFRAAQQTQLGPGHGVLRDAAVEQRLDDARFHCRSLVRHRSLGHRSSRDARASCAGCHSWFSACARLNNSWASCSQVIAMPPCSWTVSEATWSRASEQ